MPDVWSAVSDLDSATQERLAAVLETRGADHQQQSMRDTFLADIAFPTGARVLEVGCGTGVLTRRLAARSHVADVVGVDLSAALVAKAEASARGVPNVSFKQADARALPFADRTFDVVVFDSVLCHVPGPERALGEAWRVLHPGGRLAVFDGDYATTTVALTDHDPLQACVDAMMANSVNDRWFARRLPTLLSTAGFEQVRLRGHSFVETDHVDYLLTVIDRGADILCAAGHISPASAEALKAEARCRTESGRFFGHIGYITATAGKPAG